MNRIEKRDKTAMVTDYVPLNWLASRVGYSTSFHITDVESQAQRLALNVLTNAVTISFAD